MLCCRDERVRIDFNELASIKGLTPRLHRAVLRTWFTGKIIFGSVKKFFSVLCVFRLGRVSFKFHFFLKTNLQSVRAKTPGHEVFFLLSIEYDSYVWQSLGITRTCRCNEIIGIKEVFPLCRSHGTTSRASLAFRIEHDNIMWWPPQNTRIWGRNRIPRSSLESAAGKLESCEFHLESIFNYDVFHLLRLSAVKCLVSSCHLVIQWW